MADQTLQAIIAKHTLHLVEQVSSLETDLRLDGADLAAIAMAVEDEFQIVITDGMIRKWATVDDIAATVAHLRPTHPSAQVAA
jgi:acyl carrier protein